MGFTLKCLKNRLDIILSECRVFNMNNIIKIAILDSGILEKHPAVVNSKYRSFSLSFDPNLGCVRAEQGGTDKIGHGTAVYHIIRQMAPEAEITMFRIFDQETEVDSNNFAAFLQYVGEFEQFDIINLSLGVTLCDNVSQLYDICEEISKRGSIIVSAFDNGGAISFPAAFNNVIGVDASLEYKNIHTYGYIENSIVNIIGKGTIQRIAWAEPYYIISQGSSFTCAYISAIISELLREGYSGIDQIMFQLRSRAKNVKGSVSRYRDRQAVPSIKKAVLFPFNKEMHALVRFQDLLGFSIVGVFDVAKSSRVGRSTSKLLGTEELMQDFIIEDINKLDMELFDTMILGHTDELVMLLGQPDFIDKLLYSLGKYNKQVFAFDNLSSSKMSIYSCCINHSDVPQNRFGKLFQISKPVLSIVGTSSKQGKFTLQLWLRRRFLEDGYRVGQLGTEPSSLLFGMDEVFPCGYNTAVHIYNEEVLLYVNNKMWEIAQKDNDIIITGSQAGVLSYAAYNTNTYPLVHQQFLQAVASDALIICVNSFDEISFVRSCIYVAEALSKGKVIAAVCFPLKMRENWAGSLGSKEHLSKDEINELKEVYFKELNLPLYVLGIEAEMNLLYQDCVSFFSE